MAEVEKQKKAGACVELLAPARDLACGVAAIDHGADAVYIGGPSFSARSAASNSVDDIERLVAYARMFRVRVYVALNTLLNDAEIEQAVRQIHRLYEIGVDGVIIQDFGLLECDLPPLELHASTQMDIRTPQKVVFLEKMGFTQVVLARELSLSEIAEIAERSSVVLECFVHGALCVSYSGICHISEVMTGRSGNRGECAQFCRHRFSLEDADGRIFVKDRHLLSLRDLCHLENLESLLDAGIRSFKIEGRLKDISYVKNITALYRKRIDAILAKRPQLARTSSGREAFSFRPEAVKSFFRGQTDYFLSSERRKMASMQSPKSVGEEVGKVVDVRRDCLVVKTGLTLHNGDGLCFFNREQELIGFRLNRVEKDRIYPAKKVRIDVGALLYRNHDHAFQRLVEQSSSGRTVALLLHLRQQGGFLRLEVRDEDGLQSWQEMPFAGQQAKTPEKTLAAVESQLRKSGGTVFRVEEVVLDVDAEIFYPLPVIKELRRLVLEEHAALRAGYRPQKRAGVRQETACWPVEEPLSGYLVRNKDAKSFCRRYDVPVIPEEPPLDLMTCRYCLRAELEHCLKRDGDAASWKEPLYLRDKVGRYQLVFDCQNCRMLVRKAQ